MAYKLTDLADKLHRSTLAADPTQKDVLVADLHKQAGDIKYYASLAHDRISELEAEVLSEYQKYSGHVKHLKGKISELEALNKKYEEALDKISDGGALGDDLHDRINELTRIATEALNHKPE